MQYVQPVQRKWTETANYWDFSKSKEHNSVKNCSIVPELDLDLYTKFHFTMCHQCEENERKLQIKSKGHNFVKKKNGLIVPKTELDLDFLMINLYTKFHISMCIENEQ
jgi:hypothetical protein